MIQKGEKTSLRDEKTHFEAIPALEYSGNNMAPQREHRNDLDLNAVSERPLTEARMRRIWKRAKGLSQDDSEMELTLLAENGGGMMSELDSDIEDEIGIAPEIQEAIHVAMNTNMDPNQNGEKVYLTYGVDVGALKKKKGKSRKRK